MTGSNSTTGGKDAMRRALTGAACVAALLAAGSAPALAGKANDTFVWATSTEMDTPDLYYGNQREALITTYAQCDSLIHRDPMTGEYQPLLATAWNWPDPKTLDITLREGVRFTDGSSFGAEDVAYTLNQLSRPDRSAARRVGKEGGSKGRDR